MSDQTKGIHHLNIRKRIHQKHEEYPHSDKLKNFYDKFIILVGIIAPITNLPQLIKIWIEKDASGVSAVSWALFSLVSFFWVIYGVLHKEKQIILMFSLLMIIQLAISISCLILS